MKASNIKSGAKRKVTKYEIRRRFKENPEKTLKFLKEHEDKLPEKLRKKLHRYLQNHEQKLNTGDVSSIDDVLATGTDDDVILETEQDSSEEKTSSTADVVAE